MDKNTAAAVRQSFVSPLFPTILVTYHVTLSGPADYFSPA